MPLTGDFVVFQSDELKALQNFIRAGIEHVVLGPLAVDLGKITSCNTVVFQHLLQCHSWHGGLYCG